MKALESRLVLDYIPYNGNPRNSEGFFIRMDDGLLVYYCRGGTEDGFCLTRLGIRKLALKDII